MTPETGVYLCHNQSRIDAVRFKTRKLYWILPIALFIAFALWAGLETLRNLSFEAIPARPVEQIEFDENSLLYDFVNDIEVLEEKIDENIRGICSYIDGRYDCSDFRTVSLLRILYLFPDRLSEAQHKRIKETLLNFKYWMDEPGADSMCYWSENHQILFASAEYLAGQLWPEELFPNNGLIGRERQTRARRRILTWLEQRWKYGFTEWYSNVYYVEDIAALSNLIDFAGDPEIVMKATIIMDLLLFDIASQSWKGTFISNSGRLYEKHKKGGSGSSMNAVVQHIWGFPLGADERRGMDLNFIYNERYEVPDVIRAVGADEGSRVIRTSNGLDLTELKSEGLLGTEDPQIMMQWGMEAFTNPETIRNTLDIINRYKLLSQKDLNGFTSINYGLLRYSGLLPLLSRIMDPQTNGIAIQRSNSYMYRTDDYSLSTSQAYHPGSHGDQQHIWQATLSNELSIFTTHPAVLPEQNPPNGNSPTYWVGSGRLPHSVQEGNINMTLYRLPERPGPMEKSMLLFTHAWFPEGLFDEVILDERRIFARVDSTYVAVTGGELLSYIPDSGGDRQSEERNELIQTGKDTWWITELSSETEDGDFQSFLNRISGNPANFNPEASGGAGILSYRSAGKKYELEYNREFRINGNLIDTDYDRFDSPYVKVARNPDTVNISWEGHELFLDFNNMNRVAK